MSIIPTGLTRQLQFFLSGPMPCPYLPDQIERKLFARLGRKPDLNDEINSHLTRAGFRRSHDIVYRPACPRCHACVPVRLPVKLFSPSRSLRRIARLNADLILENVTPEMTEENYALFSAYQTARHPDSDMAAMSQLDFRVLMQDGGVTTRLYQLRDAAGQLMGCMIADHVADGLSAVYSFFAPEASHRSMGIQLIMALVQAAEQQGLAYVYLGYWIRDSRKMSYKNRFQPLQRLTPQGWVWDAENS